MSTVSNRSFVALAGLALIACSATAQLQGVIAQTSFGFSSGSLPFGAAVYQNGVIGASNYRTTTTGDMTVVQSLPINAPNWQIHGSGFDTFRVGPLPVEISNFRYDLNYKLVNSGGEPNPSNTPTTSFYASFSIRQRIGALPATTDPFIYNDAIGRAPLIGNGFIIDTLSGNGNHAPFVLTPGAFYYFQSDFSVLGQAPFGYIGPQIGTTIEFGGPLSAGGFQGFTSQFDYRAVPAPSASAILGLAGLGMARRRR